MLQHRSTIIALLVLVVSLPVIATAQTITAVTLSPNSVVGGRNSVGQVTLSSPAPARGFVVQLSSSNPAAAHPSAASVTVPAGATAQNFTVATFGVGQNTSVTIAAFGGGGSRTVLLNVQAVLESVTVGSSSFRGGFGTGGIVRLFTTAPAPNGVNVTISSSNPAVASVDAWAQVRPGETTATFQVVGVPVARTSTVTISATVDGVTKTAQVTVQAPVLQYLTIGPDTARGGADVTGEVTISGPAPAGGLAVALSSADPRLVIVPTSVTVPGLADKVRFTIRTSRVAKATNVKLSASANGITKSRELIVDP